MSNTSLGRGEKGSKFWMQMIPNTPLENEFNRLIGDEVRWLCPLEDEEYKEYELREKPICEALGIEEPEKDFAFWPRRQPQWDGIAVSEKSGTLYLVEAKAHLKELESRCSAGEESKRIILGTMKTVHDTQYPDGEFELWETGYYQLGNRLTFINKMKALNLNKYPNVKLVLLNFVNDYTYRSTELADWKEDYKSVFAAMTGAENIPDDVIVMYCDVKPTWTLG